MTTSFCVLMMCDGCNGADDVGDAGDVVGNDDGGDGVGGGLGGEGTDSDAVGKTRGSRSRLRGDRPHQD